MANLKLAAGCVLLMCMVVCVPSVQGITCGDVASSMAPCIGYLTSGGPVPSGCCNGLRSLNNGAKTTPDRQTVCRCLVSAAGSIAGLQPNLVSGLPASCGLNLPYQFSTSTNCNGIK